MLRRSSIAAALLLFGRLGYAHPIDDAIGQAQKQERVGDFRGALAALSKVEELGAQDYKVRLLLGWYHFNLEQYEQAAAHYQAASDLSQGSLEARLGLGWTALRQWDDSRAREHFEAILAQAPDHEGAQQGLQQLRKRSPGWGVQPHFYQTGSLTAGARERVGIASLAGLRLKLAGLSGQWDYRFVRVGTITTVQRREGRRSRQTSSTRVTATQHEGYLSIGYAARRFGIFAHGALMASQVAGTGDSLTPMVGLSGRLTVHADMMAAASYTIYDDIDILSLYIGFAIPIGSHFVSTFAATSQIFDHAVVAAGKLDVAWRWSRGSAWLGGKWGHELRPVYLDVPAIYNLAETIYGGAHGGVELFVTDNVALALTYEMHLIEDESIHPPERSSLHLLTFGLRTPF